MVSRYENISATDLTANINVQNIKPTNSKRKLHKQQKFLMHGPKFFDGLFKRLRLEINENPNGIPASALVTYILLHYKVNDMGLLPTDFVLADLGRESDIPYSTIHTGFQTLLSRQLVKEIFINGIPVYEITDYAINNRTKAEGNMDCVALSYFRIPNLLLKTPILKNLVSQRDSKGILLFLELCNSFTRELWQQKLSNINDYSIDRLMETLKKYLGRNAKRVRMYIQTISPIFKCEPVGTEVRKARKSRVSRILELKEQIFVRKFKIQLDANCVIENDDMDIKQQEARMRKEATARFNAIGYPLSSTDLKNIVIAYRNEVSEIASYIENKLFRKQFMTYTMSSAMDDIEEYVKATSKKINSIGAIVRSKLREALYKWRFTTLDNATKHEIITKFLENDKAIPEFLVNS
ncbi:hypothetical protein OB986_28085 [Bacillus cereus]|uniref:hypothetical protein n=1 Tax=Bacillus cereus TaxID=1396 RepID=UPI000BFD7BE1|nr:hypothetical protein [Bacillus cereus]MCU5065053.1 hypothetical protein [Bacillus cereus]PGR00791.1 hypothetical protein COA24_12925 [Bacillus cereus]